MVVNPHDMGVRKKQPHEKSSQNKEAFMRMVLQEVWTIQRFRSNRLEGME